MIVNVHNKVNLKGIVRYVYKRMGEAIMDYNMLVASDKVLLCTFGRKSGLSMVELFSMRKVRLPFSFSFEVIFLKTSWNEVKIDQLCRYFENRGISYKFYNLEDKYCESNGVFWCNESIRKFIYDVAKEGNYSKIALEDTLDDCIRTIIMEMLFYGNIPLDLPHIHLPDRTISIIRPLCYIEDLDIERFYNKLEIPDISYKENVVYDKKYFLINELIDKAKRECPFVKKNVIRAIKRIKKDYLL